MEMTRSMILFARKCMNRQPTEVISITSSIIKNPKIPSLDHAKFVPKPVSGAAVTTAFEVDRGR